ESRPQIECKRGLRRSGTRPRTQGPVARGRCARVPDLPRAGSMRTTIRTRLVAVFALVAALALAPASVPASASSAQTAPSSFVFYGSGFGHGVGMSQWGAYGLAAKGWIHQQILTHYYSNTTLGQSASEPSKIRVGLVDGVQYVHVAAVGGPVKLQTGAPDDSGTVIATVPAGSSYLVKGGTGSYVIVDGNGKQVAGPIDGT